MPYPAALGQRPLDLPEAYAALQQYAADYGREPLLLLMHAAVPETLRPDLLALIRQNFRPRSRHDASLDADVLFAPLTTALGGGYYRIDAQVRWHALALLRSRYRDDPRLRIRRVAELLWRYVEASEQRARRAEDPLLAEFLDVQRWVALSFLEPAGAAQAFADALRQAGEATAGGTVALRLGGLSAAIELPLGHRPELLAYARGLDALVDGDETRARALLTPLGDAPMQVGEVVLEAPAVLLRQRFGEGLEGGGKAEFSGTATATTAKPRTCLLILAKAQPRREALRDLVSAVLAAQRIDCIVTDEVSDLVRWCQLALSADLVICEVDAGQSQLLLRIGMLLALRRHGVLLFGRVTAEPVGPTLGLPLAARYADPDLADRDAKGPLAEALNRALADTGSGDWGSLVYTSAPGLEAPRLDAVGPSAQAYRPGRPGTCLVLMAFARPYSERLYASVQRAAQVAGLVCVRLDQDAPLLSAELVALLAGAGHVVVDLSDADPATMLRAGARLALRPGGTLFIAATDRTSGPFDLQPQRVLSYPAPEREGPSGGLTAFESTLAASLRGGGESITSPVYQALPTLRPALLAPPKRRVFLSYVREYLPLARALAKALGQDVEVDWDMKLEAGEVWDRRLAAMLEAADAVIAIAGRQTHDRPYPLDEMRRAVELGKRLIPVFVDGFEMPLGLGGRMAANVDPDGRILYLGELEGEALQHAIDLTARNILRTLDAPAEAPRHALTIYPPGALSSDEPPDLDSFAWRFLAAGGSWFSVGLLDPASGSNLLAEMAFGRRACAVTCASVGSRLSRANGWVSAPEFAELLHGRRALRWDALLLSFGGDDLFDAVNPAYQTSDGRMVRPGQRLLLTPSEWAEADSGPGRYLSAEGWAAFERYLLANLEQVIRLRDGGPSKGAPVFLHGFPVPTPRPAGAVLNVGPWLLPAFERCGVPPADHAALAALLVGRLNELLQRAADDVKVYRNLHFFDAAQAALAPASPSADGESGDWATEIHPTRSGYVKLATAWSGPIEAVLGGTR